MKRRVLVTGGASGIGQAVAARFLDEGAHVTVLDRIPARTDQVQSVIGDVRRADDHARAVAVAAGDHGLDVLIANAGIHDGGTNIRDLAPEQAESTFRHLFEVNVLGYVLAMHAAAEALTRARGAVILTLSDASFDVSGNGSGAAYVMTKHAGLGLVRAFARDLAPSVRVNGVAPGGVATDLEALRADGRTGRAIEDPDRLAETLTGRTLLNRGAELPDIAEAYLYLCSAPSVTGQVLRVDGGLLS